MASGISVKMGVTGVAQFKQGMKESQAAVKNLDQQLKLNEAQLKLTGNEELALQNKTALLTKQIEEQKNVVKQANSALETMQRNGVSKTSAEFQKMQQQVYKAATDLMTMQAELQNVGESGEEAQSGVSHMNQALQRIGTNVSFDSVVNGIGKITDSLEKAAKKALDMGRKLLNATLGAGNWADELVTDAKVYGMSPEDLQRMQKTSRIIDTSVEAIVSAKKKMNKGLGSADKEVMGAFAAFGLDPTQMSSVDDKFWAIGDAIYHMANAEEQEVYAQRVFGRGWAELNPLFEAGREEYEKTNAEWNVVSEKNLNKLTEMDDAYQKLSSEWETFKNNVLSSLAEGLQPVMETITEMMKQLNEYLTSEEGQDMLSKLSEAVSSLFTDLTNLNPEEVVGKVSDIFKSLEDGFNWIIQNKQSIFDALKLIAGGFALMKITSFAANIGRVVAGLNGLFSGNGTGGQGGTEVVPTGSEATGGIGGFLAGLVNKMTLAAGAYAVNKATEARIQALNTAFKELTAGKSAYEKSDIAYAQMLGMTSEEYSSFMAGKPAAQQNGSQYFMQDWRPSWQQGISYYNGPGIGGEVVYPHQVTRGNPLEEAKAAESLDRMTQVAGEMSATISPMTESSNNMTAAANSLMDLPAMIQTAVVNGISNISIIIDAAGIDAMQPRLAGGFSNKLVQMTK